MRIFLIFLIVASLVIGMAGALPYFWPAQGFHNRGSIVLDGDLALAGNLEVGGTNITNGLLVDDLTLDSDVNISANAGDGLIDMSLADGFKGELVGNVTGDITGDVTGNITGDVTGDLVGNATGWVNGRNITAAYGTLNATVISAYANETAINSSKTANKQSDYLNTTAINASKTANKQSDYLNTTAINTSKTANKQSDYLNQTAINTSKTANKQSDYLNQTAINTSITANKESDYLNTTAINTSISNLVVPLASFSYDANSVDQAIFTATGAWTLTSVKMTPTVAGTAETAVNVTVKICDSAEAPASGDIMISSALDVKGTIHTPQTGTISSAAIADGKIVAVDFSGALTSAVGQITLYGKRA